MKIFWKSITNEMDFCNQGFQKALHKQNFPFSNLQISLEKENF